MKHRLSFIQELLFDFEKTMNSFFETAKFTGEHNYKKANKILHFAIANNYMRFFKLNIKQDEQPKESPIAIPDRY